MELCSSKRRELTIRSWELEGQCSKNYVHIYIMQVRGVAAFLKEKVTLSQSEGTHQFLSPEYHRLFTNKKKNKNKKQKNHSDKGGGEGGGRAWALQDSPSYALMSNFSISNKILENFQ